MRCRPFTGTLDFTIDLRHSTSSRPFVRPRSRLLRETTMKTSLTDSVVVVGVGNEFRSDDAAGLMVARALARLSSPGVTVKESTGDGAELMGLAAHASILFIIDAVRGQDRSDALLRWDAVQAALPIGLLPVSSHAFGVAEAVELMRELKTLPPTVVIFGIKGQIFGPGAGLSPKVKQAISRLIRLVAAEIDAALSPLARGAPVK